MLPLLLSLWINGAWVEIPKEGLDSKQLVSKDPFRLYDTWITMYSVISCQSVLSIYMADTPCILWKDSLLQHKSFVCVISTNPRVMFNEVGGGGLVVSTVTSGYPPPPPCKPWGAKWIVSRKLLDHSSKRFDVFGWVWVWVGEWVGGWARDCDVYIGVCVVVCGGGGYLCMSLSMCVDICVVIYNYLGCWGV